MRSLLFSFVWLYALPLHAQVEAPKTEFAADLVAPGGGGNGGGGEGEGGGEEAYSLDD